MCVSDVITRCNSGLSQAVVGPGDLACRLAVVRTGVGVWPVSLAGFGRCERVRAELSERRGGVGTEPRGVRCEPPSPRALWPPRERGLMSLAARQQRRWLRQEVEKPPRRGVRLQSGSRLGQRPSGAEARGGQCFSGTE